MLCVSQVQIPSTSHVPQFPVLESGLTCSELQALLIVGQYSGDNQQCSHLWLLQVHFQSLRLE